MTDMTAWTEDEKDEYLGILQKLTKHNRMKYSDLEKLSDKSKYALIDLYEGIIRANEPSRLSQKIKERFMRLFK